MLIATFRLEHDAIGLDRAFEAVPELVLEAERIAAHGTTWTMPCFWATGDDFDAVDEALRADPSVDRIVETDEFDVEKCYFLDWADAVDQRVTEYVDQAGSIVEAKATHGGWEMQFRFADREQFDAFRELLAEREYAFALLELFEPGAPRETGGQVTPAQREALVAACERGYYEVPRAVTTGELSEDLETTQQSVSELLRRGTETLIRSTLVTE